jgi:hypothetical protein
MIRPPLTAKALRGTHPPRSHSSHLEASPLSSSSRLGRQITEGKGIVEALLKYRKGGYLDVPRNMTQACTKRRLNGRICRLGIKRRRNWNWNANIQKTICHGDNYSPRDSSLAEHKRFPTRALWIPSQLQRCRSILECKDLLIIVCHPLYFPCLSLDISSY